MNTKFYHLVVFLIILLSHYNCYNPKRSIKAVLLADREAPLGWVYLKMYDDHSFQFISRGLRERTVYEGTFKLNSDTILFSYRNSVPRAGKTAIIKVYSVDYIDGEYPESVEIKLNKLMKGN
jgi:hypothetical protein